MLANLAGQLTPGIRFRLKPNRADSYGEPRDKVYTVKGIRWDKHYSRVYIEVVELPEHNNTFRNDDLGKLVP